MRGYQADELPQRWAGPRPLPIGPMPMGSAEARYHAGAAVLFADIVGFTRRCERMSPQAAFTLLAGFHRRMFAVAAAHGATITDALGDGVMLVWTDPDGDRNAADALGCGFALVEAARRSYGDLGDDDDGRGLRIGVGIHAGSVVVGRTGGQPKLSAFGDTVNVAHRLERLTRSKGVDVIASDAVIAAARRAGAAAPVPLAAGIATMPGRASPILVHHAGG